MEYENDKESSSNETHAKQERIKFYSNNLKVNHINNLFATNRTFKKCYHHQLSQWQSHYQLIRHQ